MQIITLTVIWDQSSSVITFTTQLLAKQTNNQVRDRVTVTASAPSLGPDDPIWVRWPHASLGYLANVMTQEIYCAHKNGEIGSGGWLGTQSDLASAASLVSGIQEVVSNKSGDHSHNINVNWYWQEIQDRLYQIVLFIFLEFSKERLWTYVFLWRWASFFRESIFVENKERVCCPEQNAKSKSVLRLDFLMCGDEREGEEG